MRQKGEAQVKWRFWEKTEPSRGNVAGGNGWNRQACEQWLRGVKGQWEIVLWSNGLAAVRILPGGDLHMRHATLYCVQPLDVAMERVQALAERFAQAVDMPKDMSVLVERRGGRIGLTLPLPPCFCRTLSFPAALPADARSPLAVYLGRADDGKRLWLALNESDSPHVLITGTTGSGKTNLARGMALSLAQPNRPGDVALVLADHKGGYAALIALPHCAAYALDVEGEEALVGWLVERLDRRVSGEERRFPPIVLFMDEVTDLLMAKGKGLTEGLTRLAQAGRQEGIHLVLCTQRPSATVFDPMLRGCLPVRIVGKVSSATDASIAAGLPETGAQYLTGRGDMLLLANGQQVRFQSPHLPEGQLEAAVGILASRQRPAWPFPAFQSKERPAPAEPPVSDGDIRRALQERKNITTIVYELWGCTGGGRFLPLSRRVRQVQEVMYKEAAATEHKLIPFPIRPQRDTS